jgi:hypothetical protein
MYFIIMYYVVAQKLLYFACIKIVQLSGFAMHVQEEATDVTGDVHMCAYNLRLSAYYYIRLYCDLNLIPPCTRVVIYIVIQRFIIITL